MMNQMQAMATELAQQIQSQNDVVRAEIQKHLPDLLPEHDTLMKDVLEGRKGSQDVSEFFAKYHHIMKTKQNKSGLNNK